MASIRKIRLFTAIILLFGALLVWGWVLWPVSTTERMIPFLDGIASVSQTEAVQQITAGDIQIRLTWPARLHAGETGEISAQLMLDDQETALSDSGTLMGEARIDMPRVRLDPPGSIQQTFNLETLPAFRWQIRSDQPGTAAGQFWFYLLDVSADGSVEKQPILAVPIEMKTVQLFGVSEQVLTWAGAILFGAGLFVLPLHKLF
jgi:hypothetical protein